MESDETATEKPGQPDIHNLQHVLSNSSDILPKVVPVMRVWAKGRIIAAYPTETRHASSPTHISPVHCGKQKTCTHLWA